MRFDEFLLRVPNDAEGESSDDDGLFRIHFHEHLTVLAGVGALEREALIAAVVGALTGDSEGTTLRCVEHTGRPVELQSRGGGLVRARFTDDDAPAPTPIDWLAPDADSLRSLMVLAAEDLHSSISTDERDDDPPELAEARATLRQLSAELAAASDGQKRVQAVQARLEDVDRRIRIAEGDAARREYAKALAALERVRAEAAALQSGVHGAEADRHLLASADEAHRLAARWKELAGATARARMGAEAVADAGLDPSDVARLVDVPDSPPGDLPFLVTELVRTADHVSTLEERLRDVASASLPEPDDPRVLELATVDQEELWSAHDHAVEAAENVMQEQVALGGIGGDDRSEDLAELEAAHAELEQANEVLVARRQPVLLGAGVAVLFGLTVLTVAPILAALFFAAGGGIGFVGYVKPWQVRAEAARREEAACLRVGVPSYLGFHLRRVDATLDPRTLDRLTLAQAELTAAERAWTAVAGDIDLVAAASMRRHVGEYAGALRAQHGAVQEVAELRRTLDELAVPDFDAAREKVLLAVESYGIGPGDLEKLEPTLVLGFVDRQIALGRAARLEQTLQDAEADEEKVATRLEEVLARLGFSEGPLDARVGALDWAVERARERDAARAAARPRDEVENDLHRLNAEVRRLRRPEWTEVTATEANLPDAEQLEDERARLAAELAAAKEGARSVSGVDFERLADRHAAVERRVNALEVQLRGEQGDGADVEELQQYLFAALTRAHHVGPRGEPIPVLLDDPFTRVPAERKWELMDMLRRLSEKTQLFFLTDDPFVGAWARRRADASEISLLEPMD